MRSTAHTVLTPAMTALIVKHIHFLLLTVNMFYKKYGKSIVRQLTVSNFSEWLEAIHNPALFNALLLQERERK